MSSQGRNYRPWSVLEDSKLVEALVNMVNTGGFKADNGFKSGYLQHLEQVLKEALPNAGILGKPHIESRIKTMKKDWQVVYDMMHGSNTSGFGFDSQTRCVAAEPQVWESYLLVHKDAAKWRNKTFPHYEDLCIVFGKDRAQGTKAKDAIEMENATGEHIHLSDDDSNDAHGGGSNAHANEQSQECTSGSKKRRRRGDSFHEVWESTAILGDKLLKASENLVEPEMEMQKKISITVAELQKMVSLSRTDMFDAIQKIARDKDNVLIFWSLAGETREDWVRYMLEK